MMAYCSVEKEEKKVGVSQTKLTLVGPSLMFFAGTTGFVVILSQVFQPVSDVLFAPDVV
jgi:hypothetical protein